MLAKSFVCSYLRCSYLRQQVERLVRLKPKDPRSGERSYRLVRSKPKDPRRSYLRQQVERLIRSKPKDPRSGERKDVSKWTVYPPIITKFLDDSCAPWILAC